MARARMIKPEFWEDEKLAQTTRDARLTYIGLWNVADDAGNVKLSPVWIRNRLFPYDDSVTVADVTAWIGELVDIDRIRLYEHNGERYGHIVNFLKHQYIDRPSKWRNPPPPDALVEHSASTRRVGSDESELRTPNSNTKRTPNDLDDDSSSTPGVLGDGDGVSLDGENRNHSLDAVEGLADAIIEATATPGTQNLGEARRAASALADHVDAFHLEQWIRAAGLMDDTPRHISGVVEFVRKRAQRNGIQIPEIRVKAHAVEEGGF